MSVKHGAPKGWPQVERILQASWGLATAVTHFPDTCVLLFWQPLYVNLDVDTSHFNTQAVQRSAKVAPGLVNSITSVAYHFCSACLQHARILVLWFYLISVHVTFEYLKSQLAWITPGPRKGSPPGCRCARVRRAHPVLPPSSFTSSYLEGKKAPKSGGVTKVMVVQVWSTL